MIRATTLSLVITLLGLGTQLDAEAAVSAGITQLYVGSSETSITPDQPVALEGSFHLRISQGVHTPIMASVVIVESREEGRVVERRYSGEKRKQGRLALLFLFLFQLL